MNSVLGRRVRVGGGAKVSGSILMENSRIGDGANLHGVIVDRNAVVEPGTEIGFDPSEDGKKYHISEGGIVVVSGPPTEIPLSSVEV